MYTPICTRGKTGNWQTNLTGSESRIRRNRCKIRKFNITLTSQRHKKSRERPIFRRSRDSAHHSNSSADNLNQLFFFHCEQSYYPHSSKNVVLFMSFQIFRAKIEPGKDIYPRFLQLLLYRYNIWLRLSKFNITFQHSHSFSHFSLNLSDICLLVNIK